MQKEFRRHWQLCNPVFVLGNIYTGPLVKPLPLEKNQPTVPYCDHLGVVCISMPFAKDAWGQVTWLNLLHRFKIELLRTLIV